MKGAFTYRAAWCVLAAVSAVAQESRTGTPATPVRVRLGYEVRAGDAALVTLTRTVKGRLRADGRGAASVEIDEKTSEIWLDHRLDGGPGWWDDRRVFVESQTTLGGVVADSGYAGMTGVYWVRVDKTEFDRRNVLPPDRFARLDARAASTHVPLAGVDEAWTGVSFDAHPEPWIAAAFDVPAREASLALVAEAPDPKTGVVRLTGTLAFVADVTAGSVPVAIAWRLQATAELDPSARRLVALSLKGKGAPVAGGVKASGELTATVAISAKRVADVAAWTPPPPAWRDNVHREGGTELRLPSYWVRFPLDPAIDFDATAKFVDRRSAPAPTLRIQSTAVDHELTSPEFARWVGLDPGASRLRVCATGLGKGFAYVGRASTTPPTPVVVRYLPLKKGAALFVAISVDNEEQLPDAEAAADVLSASAKRVK